VKRILLGLALILSACATDPDKMTASYVSPIEYQDYSCKQLGAEAKRINRKVHELYGTLEKEADNDAAQMGIGLVLFWPTLFFLEGGDGPQAAEYRRLKGEYDAIEQASIQKECNIEFAPIVPEKTTEQPVKTKPKTNF